MNTLKQKVRKTREKYKKEVEEYLKNPLTDDKGSLVFLLSSVCLLSCVCARVCVCVFLFVAHVCVRSERLRACV